MPENQARVFKQVGLAHQGTYHNPSLPLDRYKYQCHVITPGGIIKRMIPSIHGADNQNKIINTFFHPKSRQYIYRLSTWAYDDGYRFLDEIADKDGYKEFLAYELHYRDNPKSRFVPFPYARLGQEVLNRQKGQSTDQAPFKFSDETNAMIQDAKLAQQPVKPVKKTKKAKRMEAIKEAMKTEDE